jgi:hypothetical protein
MLSGHGYASPFCGSTGPSAFLAPGYPLIVTAAFRLFGPYSAGAAMALIALQIAFGALLVLALMLLSKRLFGAKVATLAGLFCAASPTIMWLPVLFWETSLSALLLTGVFVVALYCVDRPARHNWAGFGLYCALAMFVNPSLLTTFAAVLLWTAWKCGRGGRIGPAIAALTFCVVFSVWPVRNALRMHAFVPLRSNLGYELWQGNQAGSDGRFARYSHPNASDDEYRRYAEIGEVAYMREKSEQAMAAVRADKIRFLKLTIARFARFWTNAGSDHFPDLLTQDLLFTTLMSVIGLGLLARRRPDLAGLLAIPYALFPAPYYLTHADYRFRLLLDPLALLLTAYVLRECVHLARARSGRPVLAVSATSIGAARS